MTRTAMMPGAVEVCPICDIAGCRHISERQAQSARPTKPGFYWGRWHTPADIDPVHPEDLRLQRGRMLLAETNLSVTDVAMACSYASRSAFSKGFRAKFGTSPQAFNTFANRVGDDAPP